MKDSLLHPKNRSFVTTHIQQPHELDRVFKKYLGMLQEYKIIDIKATLKEQEMIDSPRYYIFMLGLLAMQLGCTLSRKHHRWMKANWDSCLFMYERLDQAMMAAFEHQMGKQLQLDSKTLHEKGRSLGPNEGEFDPLLLHRECGYWCTLRHTSIRFTKLDVPKSVAEWPGVRLIMSRSQRPQQRKASRPYTDVS